MKKLKQEYKESDKKDVWVNGILLNFIYGLLGSTVVASYIINIDIVVIIALSLHFFFIGKILNRPKYVTSLGKFIVFPIPAMLGAFIGYKVTPIIVSLL